MFVSALQSVKRYRKIMVILTMIIIATFYMLFSKKTTSTASSSHVTTVALTPVTSTLFYSGIIQSVKLSTISSVTEGVIEKMLFTYGEKVKRDQLLFIVASEKIHADYKIILMQYIKSRSDLLTTQNQMKQSAFLHKNKLISDDEFKSKQTAYYSAELEMLQSKTALAALLKKMNLTNFNVYDLKIEDTDKIKNLIESKDGLERLKILSPATGVILQSSKVDQPGGELKRISLGDQIKSGDNLGIICDDDRLLIHINVSEFNINQLVLGQKVKVTGAAFPDIELNGKITDINRQGELSANGVPSFPIIVSVADVKKEQKSLIRMGMSAQVAIEINDGNKILVPINAVIQKDNRYFVIKQNVKTQKFETTPVKLGKTIMNSVVVESDLIAGDKIVTTN